MSLVGFSWKVSVVVGEQSWKVSVVVGEQSWKCRHTHTGPAHLPPTTLSSEDKRGSCEFVVVVP